MSRVLLKIKKASSIKFISHLDFVKAFEYGLRRSKLPISFTEGFNPRPKMSFGNAAGVGVSSDDERIVLDLSQAVEPNQIKTRLNEKLPPGMQVISADEIPEDTKSELGKLNASEYQISISSSEVSKVERILNEIMDSTEYTALRHKSGSVQSVNFRPYVISMDIIDASDKTITINASFKTTNSGGGRPQDIIQILTNAIPDINILEIRRLQQFQSME
jgi:radical SAM-linked protein